MNKLNKSLPAEFARRAKSVAARAGTAVAGLAFGGMALAQTDPSPAEQVVTAINGGKTDAILIATTVVLALWAIWSIYLLRRKG